MYPKELPALIRALEQGYDKGHHEAHVVHESPSFEDVRNSVIRYQLEAIRARFYLEDDDPFSKVGGTD